jgi:hypothetical protein
MHCVDDMARLSISDLPEHHAAIERACFEVLAAALADDPRLLVERWRELERLVEEHFAFEEGTLLPAFERVSPREAAIIREEHAKIREAMARLGVEVELHVVTAATVGAVVARLRAHALREDATLYAWAAMLPSASVREANESARS